MHSGFQINIDRDVYERLDRSPDSEVDYYGHKVEFDITGGSLEEFYAQLLRDHVDFTYTVGIDDPEGDLVMVKTEHTISTPEALPAPKCRNDFHTGNMRYIEETARAEGEFENWYIQGEGQGQSLSEAIEEAETRTSLGIETPEGMRVDESRVSDYLDGY
ncbi:MAG: hypothetical protein ABEI58_01405 [Candidatus Nanohaloarchaea archaeon]